MNFSILQLLIFAMQILLSLQVCAPDCKGKATGDQVKDPTDCNRFYVCHTLTSGEVIVSENPYECQQGEIFDESVPGCAKISAVTKPCDGLCNPCSAPDCTVEGPGTNHPNPANCSTYYTCLVGGRLQTDTCPQGELYDYKQERCVKENAACYNFCDICEPYCVEVGDFPDKTDCHYFYYCEPPYLVRFECPVGTIFDAGHNECREEEGAICLEFCE